MALSQQKIGEMAMKFLQHKLEEDGTIRLNPKEIRREIANNSKKVGATPQEGAEFAKIIIEEAYKKTMAEIDSMIAD